MIQVLIAEDQPVIRDGLKFIIEQDSEIKVVGCAGNGKSAYELCASLQPDVVLMDIVMPECDGIEGTRLIKADFPAVKVIVLTTFSDNEKIQGVLKNGADGYILKDIESDDLIFTIKKIHKGLRIIHKDAYEIVTRELCAPKTEKAAAAKTPGGDLSARELDVLRLIVYGKSNKEIASSLYLSDGSVRNMISGLLVKFKLKDRTQLAVYAVKNNLI